MPAQHWLFPPLPPFHLVIHTRYLNNTFYTQIVSSDIDKCMEKEEKDISRTKAKEK